MANITKKWYTSKTLWVNFIAICGIILAPYTGIEVIPDNLEAPILGIINLLLRTITKEKIEWNNKGW